MLIAAATTPPGPPWHLLFPLASSLLYVMAALSLRQAAERKAGVWRSTFIMNVVAAICFLPLVLMGQRGPGPTPPWQAVVVAVLFISGQSLTMLALSKGDVSVATPVVGTKVIFVAIFVTLLVGDPLPTVYWLSAAMSAAGIVLLNRGGGQAGARRRNLALTILLALGAAVAYALFDVLVRKWAPVWGVGRLLPAVMGLSAVLSLALWPAFEGPLIRLPRSARVPLVLGSIFLGLQALFLVRTLGLYPDTTRINIVYNSRGLWSVLAVWLVGHWWGNTEGKAGRAIFLWRLAGAALMLGAIVVAVMR